MVVSRLSLSVSAISIMLVLSACASAGGGRVSALAPFGGAPKSTQQQNSLLASLGNGLLGGAAGQLNAADRQKALEAEYRALEYSSAGKAVSWTGSNGASGDVVAAQPYQVGSQNCRQYTHTFTIGGTPQTSRGTACRNADGSWTSLT